MYLRLALCAVLSASLGLVAYGAEAPAKPGEAEVQKLIRDLSSEDFDTREKAEAALLKAGSDAIPLLSKALEGGDAEVRTRGKRILDELAWAVRPPVSNVAAVLPPSTIFLLHTTDLKAGVQKLRTETALGKLYDRSELAEVRNLANAAITKQMSDDEKKIYESWLDRFGGPSCISFMSTDPTKQDWRERDLAVLVIGINDPNAHKAYTDLSLAMPIGQGEQMVRERYHGIEVEHINGEWRQNGRARVLNLAVNTLDSSYQSVKLVVDQAGSEKAPKLASAPAFVEAQGKVDAAPVASLYFSPDELIKQLSRSDRQNANDKAVLNALGFDAVKTVSISLSTGNDLIAERAWVKVDGERKGVMKLLSFGKTTGRLAALAPVDALVLVTIPADGKLIYDTILSISKAASPNDAAQFEASIGQMNEGLGIKIVEDIIAPLQGEASLWVSKPAGPMPIPELGAAFEAKDAASAKTLSDSLAKLVAGAMGKPEACGSADFKGRTCHWVNKEAMGKDAPYTVSWCADGARVLVATSQQGLQTLVNRIENKAAGLDSAEDYKRLMATMPEADRGGTIYLNTAEVGGWGLPILLPFAGEGAPPEVKEKLEAALKDPKGLLKGFPGTLLSISGAADGIQARGIGGLSASTEVVAIPAIIAQFMFRRAMMEVERAAVKAQELEEAKAEEAKSEAKSEAAPAPAPAPEK